MKISGPMNFLCLPGEVLACEETDVFLFRLNSHQRRILFELLLANSLAENAHG